MEEATIHYRPGGDERAWCGAKDGTIVVDHVTCLRCLRRRVASLELRATTFDSEIRRQIERAARAEAIAGRTRVVRVYREPLAR